MIFFNVLQTPGFLQNLKLVGVFSMVCLANLELVGNLDFENLIFVYRGRVLRDDGGGGGGCQHKPMEEVIL